MKRLLLLAASWFWLGSVFAQSQYGEIKGSVVDKATGKPVEDAFLALSLNGVKKASFQTSESGSFNFKTLDPGEYSLRVAYTGYDISEITGIDVNAGSFTELKVELERRVKELIGTKVTGYKKPIISPDGVNGGNFSAKTLTNIPTRSINTLVGLSANVNSFNGGTPSFSGSRASGTAYYVDGVRVIGNFSVPRSSIDQVQVIVGGTPAQYGDFVGGVINVTLKGPSRYRQGGLEIISSSATDKFHFNQIEGYQQGPLIVIHKKSPKERTLLGYMISGNVIYLKDPSPSAIGNWYVKEDVLKSIEQNPLQPSKIGTGFVNRAEFVTAADLENLKAKKNSPSKNVNATGQLNYQPSKNINITLGARFSYIDNTNYSLAGSLFNYANNSHSTRYTSSAYIRMTHYLKRDEGKKAEDKNKPKSLVTSAYYTIRFDYTNDYTLSQDSRHGDRIFDYGYLGKYTSYRAPLFVPFNTQTNSKPKAFKGKTNTGADTTLYLTEYREQVAMVDDSLSFDRSDLNAVRANYTQSFYDYVRQREKGQNYIQSADYLRANLGLLNGDGPQSVYSMWTNVGSAGSGYGKTRNDMYTLFAMSEVTLTNKYDDKKKHDFQFGLQYEQRNTRSYSVATTGIWSLMRQLAVADRPTRDLANPILSFDANGVFQDTISYNLIVNPANEGNFSRNLRKSLMEAGEVDANGKKIDQNSYLDVDQYTPHQYKLNYFSPDELLNNGSAFVSYFGYDAYGNVVKGKPSLNSFFNDSAKRSIGSFQPVYIAAFVQDKFAFKDLIFRVGMRIDRYDANQYVLSDPYSLYPTMTVGEVKASTKQNIATLKGQLNSTMSDNYIVYVNDVDKPTNIVGYRYSNDDNNVTRWYDKTGNAINDPAVLSQATTSGLIAPLLAEQNSKQKLSANSFRDYKPLLYFLPRIWFKFPISTTAQFFANYDVLTQRPTEGSISTIDDYYFLKARATEVFNNPNLRPQRTTAYELGFKQAIGDNAGLSLIATYREMRDLIQLYKYNGAYPLSYTTFGNIDFGTVKGFRVEYEMRDDQSRNSKNKHVNLTANYALLFADGTGSNATSSQSLINSGQPNLRTLFPLDFDVRHTIKGNFDFHLHDNEGPASGKHKDGTAKYPLQNAGINIIMQTFSGLPYTAISQPINEGQGGIVQRAQVKGNVNGSRRPWQVYTDMTIDKSWNLNTKKKDLREGKKPKNINAYIWISNLFNIQNIQGVYRYTGQAGDDGYLASATGQAAIRAAVDQQSFMDLYSARINNPTLYSQPRMIRLGFRYNY
ncbi:MAG: hypothetical protein EXR21_04495 [Flavobacteriaceae bacterium]|nr:hypothetical protein [Flavobacteriaceae bacterium]